MKKTSRRKFGKQLTGALAALPVAAMAMEQHASAQDQKKAPTRATSAQSITTSHNTPPDLVISEGSLHFESFYPFTPPAMGGQPPFRYVSSGRAEMGHIRVLQDNGDKIYEDIEGETQKVKIVWEDDAGPQQDRELVFAADGSNFVVTSDQRFNVPNGTPAAAHRRYKFNHPGMITAFTAPPPSATGNEFMPHEFRVLIWRH
jgi:hypothetical protein